MSVLIWAALSGVVSISLAGDHDHFAHFFWELLQPGASQPSNENIIVGDMRLSEGVVVLKVSEDPQFTFTCKQTKKNNIQLLISTNWSNSRY